MDYRHCLPEPEQELDSFPSLSCVVPLWHWPAQAPRSKGLTHGEADIPGRKYDLMANFTGNAVTIGGWEPHESSIMVELGKSGQTVGVGSTPRGGVRFPDILDNCRWSQRTVPLDLASAIQMSLLYEETIKHCHFLTLLWMRLVTLQVEFLLHCHPYQSPMYLHILKGTSVPRPVAGLCLSAIPAPLPHTRSTFVTTRTENRSFRNSPIGSKSIVQDRNNAPSSLYTPAPARST